jgi:hypothetical protein
MSTRPSLQYHFMLFCSRIATSTTFSHTHTLCVSTITMQLPLLFGLLVCLWASLISAFTTPSFRFGISSSRTTTTCFLVENENNSDDFPDNTDYVGDVDWDAEWKKVVQDKDSKRPRPGSKFYKTDVEIALTKTVNKAASKVVKVSSQLDVPKMNWNSLKGDWKFWLAILAMLSVGTSVLSGMGMSQTYSPDSYYI